jgi:hypothetical protein
VKFTLGGDMGLDIFATGYPLSRQTPNPQETMDGVEQTGDHGRERPQLRRRQRPLHLRV